nr:kielin/chordin-like protein isoform X2 [Biomphalaria glabrata]
MTLNLICVVVILLYSRLDKVCPESTIEPPNDAMFCVYNGKSYMVGSSFKPNDCTFCDCETNGEYICAMSSCGVPDCPNPVKVSGQCCLVCV